MIYRNLPLRGRTVELAEALTVGLSDGPEATLCVSVPLRICPLGAHVDHQGGVVTGLTVDRTVDLAAARQSRPLLTVSSSGFPGTAEVDLERPERRARGDWADPARAAAAVLASRARLTAGLRAVVAGDLPGAGLSSSAAVLIAYLVAIATVNEIRFDRGLLATWVQEAENEVLGVASGQLDPSIILYSEMGRLTTVDCTTLEIGQVPLPDGVADAAWVVVFSGVARSLAGSGFNVRVEECRRAARRLLELAGEGATEGAVLGDVSEAIGGRYGGLLDRSLQLRARHYFSEQARVRAGIAAWHRGNLPEFGRLMTASGASSIENYQCGTPEIVALWRILTDSRGVLGTRFSGAGFGGSVLALVERAKIETIYERVAGRYRADHPKAAAAAAFHVCNPSGSVRVEGPDP